MSLAIKELAVVVIMLALLALLGGLYVRLLRALISRLKTPRWKKNFGAVTTDRNNGLAWQNAGPVQPDPAKMSPLIRARWEQLQRRQIIDNFNAEEQP